jgi:hypothetical protein
MTAFLECIPRRPQPRIAAEPYSIWQGGSGQHIAQFFRSGSDYLVRFPGVADFRVDSNGRHVTCCPTPTATDAAIAHLWENQVQPLALAHQGHFVLHASAVALDGERAIAFLGPSGRGKSTLAAAFALRGCPYLTDDVLQVRQHGESWHAVPRPPSLRLWEDARNELLPSPEAGATHAASSGKANAAKHYAIPACAEPRKLQAAFVIGADRSPSIGMERLRSGEAAIAWVSNGFTLDTTEPSSLRAQFDRVCAIAAAIPTMKLNHPGDWKQLGQLMDQIVATALTL